MTADEIIDKWIGKPFPGDDAAIRNGLQEIAARLKADIEQAITARAEQENEACAQLADAIANPRASWGRMVGEAIRARYNDDGRMK